MGSKGKRTSGTILVFAMWTVALLAMLAGAMVLQARVGTRHQEWTRTDFEARVLNMSSVRVAMELLVQDETEGFDSYQDAWL